VVENVRRLNFRESQKCEIHLLTFAFRSSRKSNVTSSSPHTPERADSASKVCACYSSPLVTGFLCVTRPVWNFHIPLSLHGVRF
jgi:hypothetical protein